MEWAHHPDPRPNAVRPGDHGGGHALGMLLPRIELWRSDVFGLPSLTQALTLPLPLTLTRAHTRGRHHHRQPAGRRGERTWLGLGLGLG